MTSSSQFNPCIPPTWGLFSSPTLPSPSLESQLCPAHESSWTSSTSPMMHWIDNKHKVAADIGKMNYLRSLNILSSHDLIQHSHDATAELDHRLGHNMICWNTDSTFFPNHNVHSCNRIIEIKLKLALQQSSVSGHFQTDQDVRQKRMMACQT